MPVDTADTKTIPPLPFEQYHTVVVKQGNHSAMLDWALHHCQGKFSDTVCINYEYRQWHFQLKSDAMLFSIKWSDNH